MNDLDRLFRQLVDVLTASDPKRVSASFQISELYQSILPYRTFKKQLGFECNEDYEMALLRLFAGESGYATVEPDEVREQLRLEAQAIHPNPGAFHDFAAARVKLNEDAVRAIRGASRAFAPPNPSPTHEQQPSAEQWKQFAPPLAEPTEPIVRPPVFEAVDHTPTAKASEPKKVERTDLGPKCGNCNERLPANRTIVFCPFCGTQTGPSACPGCGDEIEVGWRFCVTCGRSNSKN